MSYEHKTGDGALRRLWKAEAELESLYAHLRAVVGNPDPEWTGWRHAIEMLIPDSGPRIEELLADMRAKGLDALADRFEYVRDNPRKGEER